MSGSRRRSRSFAPATVANLACGFDVLGLALEAPGDTVRAEVADEPGIFLASIEGDGGRLSRDPGANTATVAVRKLLDRRKDLDGVGIRIQLSKGLPLASGMGSSAASAVGAALAVDDLLELDLSYPEILAAALEGERVVAGSAHADNASACLYGGLVLVRSTAPLDVVQLPVPEGLSVAILRPHLEMSTKDSRVLLGDQVRLSDATQQWGNLGGLVAGLYTRDLGLVSRSLTDRVAEPLRAPYVPGFGAVKRAALEAGALGSSLSGSGPSIFALGPDLDTANVISKAMSRAFAETTELGADVYVSRVCSEGARILADPEADS